MVLPRRGSRIKAGNREYFASIRVIDLIFLRAPNSHPLSSMLTYVRVFTVRIANIFTDNLVHLTNGECRFVRAVFSNTKSVRMKNQVLHDLNL